MAVKMRDTYKNSQTRTRHCLIYRKMLPAHRYLVGLNEKRKMEILDIETAAFQILGRDSVSSTPAKC